MPLSMLFNMAFQLPRIELLDVVQVRACNQYSGLIFPETPLLLLEFHGSEASVAEQAELFASISEDYTDL